MSKEIFIVPEPKELSFSGKWFEFDGFENFPEFLAEEFGLGMGKWKISKVSGEGTGVRVKEGVVEYWGDENVALATVIQLTRQRKGYLPEVTVRESFRFSIRGYHLDIARGGVPKVETFKRILRWLFLLKYNYFAIYFEDLFPWEKYPQIGARRGRLTKEELSEIVEYGGKLGIEVFPSLELTGHMENILVLPEFRKYSEWHRPREGCIDLSNDEARRFTYDLLQEVLDFFDSEYIHVGGDETWALGRGKSLNKTWRFEGPRLYLEHHKKMLDMVEEKGKKPMLWGDMVTGMYLSKEEAEKWSEVLNSDIWKRAIIANWDYSGRSKDFFRDKIRIFSKRGLKQVACPGLSNWNRYYPDFDKALENLKNFLGAAREEDVLGFLVTAWGDDGEECLFSFLDPLILAAMEYAEGNGEWEKKWLILSGESREVLEIRKLFGKSKVANSIKWIMFTPLEELEELKKYVGKEYIDKEIIEKLLETDKVLLPKDLSFIREAIFTCLKKIEGKATVSDFIRLANLYSELWLAERKAPGLQRILNRFWGSASNIDLHYRLKNK